MSADLTPHCSAINWDGERADPLDVLLTPDEIQAIGLGYDLTNRYRDIVLAALDTLHHSTIELRREREHRHQLLNQLRDARRATSEVV